MRVPIPSRSALRGALIIGLIVLAVGVDAATGFNLMVTGGCITLFFVQLVAVTVGTVLIVVGLIVWIFSRFRSQQALYVVFGAVALDIVVLLLKDVVVLTGLGCID